MALQKVRERGDREALMARFRENRRRLRLIRGEAKPSPKPRVVAEVMSDGTIRELDGTRAWDTKSEDGFHQGAVAGDGWTLWWQHRPWAAKTA
jgi:hypothetical protein